MEPILPTWYDTGTVSVDNGDITVIAAGSQWGRGAIMVGDLFCDPAQPLVPPQRVKAVIDNTHLELWAPWPGTGMTAAPYEIRYVGIIERSTAQTRNVLEQLGEVNAFFDVQVDTLADRDAFDERPAGYRVLVSNIGDGRAAIYSKASSVAADWSDPAPVGIEGPVGPIGIAWQGAWDSGTTYALHDGVAQNGSSWRSLQAGNTNHAPPNLPTTSNAWWSLVAAKGADGAGTVAGITGGAGINVNPANPALPVVSLVSFTGDSGSGGALGGVPAPAAGDAVADKVLGANGTWIPRRASADAVYSVCEELTNTIPIGAIPPNTAGTEIVWANFAASSATAKVRVRFVGYAIHKTADNGLAAILIMDGETTARAAACANPIGAGYMVPIVLEYVFSPGDTANHLYIIRAGATGGVMLMNGFAAGTPAFGGMLRSRLLVEEI